MGYPLVVWASAVCALLVPDVLAAQFCSPRFQGDCAGNVQDLVMVENLVGNEIHPFPAIADWDQDGDPDLIVGTGDGSVRYFERVDNNTIDERIGEGHNPFHGIDVGFDAAPAVADWDQDGDPDLIVGTGDGRVRFFHNGCASQSACAGNGLCDMVGRCTCISGYGGAGCASCDDNYYTEWSGLSQRRICKACPNVSDVCSARGICVDDATARNLMGSSATLSMLAIGNGTCICAPQFSGESCETGCPAGWEETAQIDGPNYCSACLPGYFSAPGSGCSACPPGHHPTDDQSDCVKCDPGHYAANEGSGTCDVCPMGHRPTDDQSDCVQCDVGKYASSEGSGSCQICAPGMYSYTIGNATCDHDPLLWVVLLTVAFVELVGWCPSFFVLRRRPRVSDVRSTEDGVLITLHAPHSMNLGRTIDTMLVGTRNLMLDSRQGWEPTKVVDATRLQLTEVKVVAAEASGGVLKVRFPQELICTRTAFKLPPVVHTFVAFALAAGASFFVDVLIFAGRTGSHAWYLICANLVGFVCALPVAAFLRWRHASVPTRLDMRIHAFREKLLNDNPKPERTERGPHRAVSAGKIHELLDFFSDFISNRNAYYLSENILMPLTKPSQLSVAELMGPQLVNFFVSHFWGSPFLQFVETIRQHAEFTASDGWRSLTYWVCFLSNNQWDVQNELGNGDWRQSSFFLALQSQTCRATCMVLDRWAKPLHRSWCLFEVLQTYKLVNATQVVDAPVMADEDVPNHTFQGLVFCTADGIIGRHDCFDTAIALAKSLSSLSVHDATATNPDDQRMIMELVDEEEGQTGTTMDAFLLGNMRSTLQLAKDKFDKEANSISDMLGLAPAGSSMSSTLETANVEFDEQAVSSQDLDTSAL